MTPTRKASSPGRTADKRSKPPASAQTATPGPTNPMYVDELVERKTRKVAKPKSLQHWVSAERERRRTCRKLRAAEEGLSREE